MTPEQFDEWMAAYLTGQLDDGWQQTAMIASTIVNVARGIALGMAGKKITKADMIMPDAFLPQLPGKKKKRRNRSVYDFHRYLAAHFKGA